MRTVGLQNCCKCSKAPVTVVRTKAGPTLNIRYSKKEFKANEVQKGKIMSRPPPPPPPSSSSHVGEGGDGCRAMSRDMTNGKNGTRRVTLLSFRGCKGGRRTTYIEFHLPCMICPLSLGSTYRIAGSSPRPLELRLHRRSLFLKFHGWQSKGTSDLCLT